MPLTIPRLVVAGTHSGAGKTSVMLGLLSALRARGVKVSPFKVGPDFIDPLLHAQVAGVPSRNLDPWMLGEEGTRELFCRSAASADIALIEGVMGLHDGVSGSSDEGSAAHVARVLQAPVVLVLDAKAMARSAAAVVLGYESLDRRVDLRAVLANRVSGERHFMFLHDAIRSACRAAPVGFLPPDPEAALPERHLGLVSTPDRARLKTASDRLGSALATTGGLDRLLEIAHAAPPLAVPEARLFSEVPESSRVRVAVARDEAFHFYYEDGLDLLRHHGAEFVPFSPLHDREIPSCDLVYLGGGYPELHAGAIAENRPMLESLRAHARKGKAVYGECGGLMVLLERLTDVEGRAHAMAGLLPGASIMERRRQGLGYLEVKVTRSCLLGATGDRFRAHEFHYSRYEGTSDHAVLRLVKPSDEGRSKPDGFAKGSVMAGYAHVHLGARPDLARTLLDAARGRP
ncbi:MAG: cobyrinate a,c-diamide synthase [Planctomycetes bacterium]|nr:cobyrinate a,c-diamide synthase [Planctomycetota bacterium]